MKFVNRIAGAFIGATLAVSGASLRAEEAAVTLARVYKTGTVVRYKSHSVASLSAGIGAENTAQSEINSTTRQTVKEVKPNGETTLELASEGGTWTFDGDTHEVPATPPFVITQDKFGKVVSYKSNGAGQNFADPAVERLIADTRQIVLPPTPVKVNESWETLVENTAVKGKKVTIKSAFLGVEKVNGVALWKVKQMAEAETDTAGAKMTGEIIVWLDPANGHEVKSENKVRNVPTQFGIASFDSTTEEITPDAKGEKTAPAATGKTDAAPSRPAETKPTSK